MSQISKGILRSFIIRCSDVGLDCGHIIFGDSEYRVMQNAVIHMYEYHAIIPEEMTTCMKLKISNNIYEMSLETSSATNLLHYQNAEIVP